MQTAKADNRRRVLLPQVKPGHVYAVQDERDGSIKLTLLTAPEPQPAKVRFVKRGRFATALTDRPIHEDAIKELLADFP
jgi:hypothetical protein